MIFLVTLIIGITAVSAEDISNTTLSSDNTNTIGSDIQEKSLILDNNVNISKESIIESNDNVSIKSENLESNSQVTNTNSLNTINSSKTIKTEIEPEDITIDLKPVNGYANQNITINATVKTENGEKIDGVSAVFKVNGITYGTTTVVNGVASFKFTIPNWSAKDYDITIKVAGTKTNLEKSTSTKLTINKRDVVINYGSYTAFVNSQITLKANVSYADGGVVNNTPIVFKVNGVTIGTTKVINGVANFTYTVPSSNKNYELYVKVGSTSVSNEANATSTLVLYDYAKINTNTIFFTKKNSTVTIYANVTNSKGTSLAKSGKVSFKINGKTIETLSLINGYASITYDTSKLSQTINNISIVYSGNDNLLKTNTTSILRVQSSISKYTYSQILQKANDTKNFIEKNGRLPNYVTIGNDQISPADFLYLLCEVYNGNNSYVLGYFSQSTSSKTNCDSVKIYKEDYISLAKSIVKCYAINGRSPVNITINGNYMDFADAFYFYTRAVAYIYNNNVCSAYGTVITLSNSFTGDNSSVSVNTVPSGYEGYLVSTNNCQVNNSAIINAVREATAGISGIYNQAVAIFNYVNDHTDYSGYYNTRYGAVKTLSIGYGNCVDMAHLVIAMMRTANIPARYAHATCTFRSGLVTGHVWAEVYVNGVWYKCDATSSSNTFGNIVNWLSCGTIKRYTELPF